jgi:hypothetical protein
MSTTNKAVHPHFSLCPSGSSERNDIENLTDRMINVLPAEEKTIVGKFLCQTVGINQVAFFARYAEITLTAK